MRSSLTFYRLHVKLPQSITEEIVTKLPIARLLRKLPTSAVRGSADKSLARPGRKQATANKLGIYSTHSPRSSIHFLAPCSNFCKPLKKIRRLSVQPGLRGCNDLRVGRKIVTFQSFFSVQGKGVVRGGQIRRIGWVIKILEAQVGQSLLGCKCPVRRDCRAKTRPPWWTSSGVFPSKCLSIAPTEMSNTPRW